MAVAREVAERLREPEQATIATARAKEQTGYPKSVYWQPYGIAQGDAGVAVACAYFDACFPDQGWDVVGHRYLERAARSLEGRIGIPPGLFAGLSGVAFATWSLSRHGTRYRKLLATVEAALLPQVHTIAATVPGRTPGLGVHQFDAISGLSGMGAYLLCRRDEPGPAGALAAVLRALVRMTAQDAEPPFWYTPASLLDEHQQGQYPHGNLNCGLAHGIPGPLALLSLAHRCGVVVDGIDDAIDRISRWLVRNRLEHAYGVTWPTAVPVLPLGAGVAPRSDGPLPASAAATRPSRTAWCYGSPGIARALWLAGEALNDHAYRGLAVAAMDAVYRTPVTERHIDSPTFCHGVAGLLQITLRFARDTALPVFAANACALVQQLLAQHEPDSLLGYRAIEPDGRRVDQPGLLDGAPGVALALLAAATGVASAWDRLFLLS